MLAESGLFQDLQCRAFTPASHLLCLYGDPAYPLRVHLQGPFKGSIITPQMQAFNSAMITVRISVEWLFGDITNYLKFVDFKKNLKVCLSSIGKMYIVCAILHNALTCLYGNQTSSYPTNFITFKYQDACQLSETTKSQKSFNYNSIIPEIFFPLFNMHQ